MTSISASISVRICSISWRWLLAFLWLTIIQLLFAGQRWELEDSLLLVLIRLIAGDVQIGELFIFDWCIEADGIMPGNCFCCIPCASWTILEAVVRSCGGRWYTFHFCEPIPESSWCWVWIIEALLFGFFIDNLETLIVILEPRS